MAPAAASAETVVPMVIALILREEIRVSTILIDNDQSNSCVDNMLVSVLTLLSR
jgi:hypothetical protein